MSDQPRRPRKPYRRPQKDPVRILAFEALRAVDERDAYANLVLPPLLRKAREGGDFDARDAALATELVYGTLRRQGTYDAIVAACVDRPLREVDPPVLDVLSLGVHQLLGTRIPTHGSAVSSATPPARRTWRRPGPWSPTSSSSSRPPNSSTPGRCCPASRIWARAPTSSCGRMCTGPTPCIWHSSAGPADTRLL
ncbi:hypothetical protein SHIRM173S_05491 [Streptomyces hirsutus]